MGGEKPKPYSKLHATVDLALVQWLLEADKTNGRLVAFKDVLEKHLAGRALIHHDQRMLYVQGLLPVHQHTINTASSAVLVYGEKPQDIAVAGEIIKAVHKESDPMAKPRQIALDAAMKSLQNPISGATKGSPSPLPPR